MTRKVMQRSILGAINVGVLVAGLLGGLMWDLTPGHIAWAQESATVPAPKVNSALPGLRTGMLTKFQGGTAQIDRKTYVLAPDARVEDSMGNPVSLQVFAGTDVEVSVQYWVGPGDQIAQMIVTFAQ